MNSNLLGQLILLAALLCISGCARSICNFEPMADTRRGAQGYVEWITEAKRDATRATRLAQAVEWMAEGKRRNWKYENC